MRPPLRKSTQNTRGDYSEDTQTRAIDNVGYVLGGPVVSAPGLIAATVAGTAVVGMLSAVLGGHDPRSPFVHLMLIVCVITGRRPGDYLPPMSPPPETKLAAGHPPPAITQSDRMPLSR